MKNTMTKELLNTVLNIDVIWVNVVDNEVRYGTDNYEHSFFKMNLDTFARKCKEWAVTKNHILNSACGHGDYYAYCKVPGELKDFRSYTESEAIFEACEWILNQTKDNI